jgi:hypothetical protein
MTVISLWWTCVLGLRCCYNVCSAPVRSLGGSPEADADCALHRRHMENGRSCVGFRFVDDRYGFLLRCLSCAGVPDLEFNDVPGVLPRSKPFNGNGFVFGQPS